MSQWGAYNLALRGANHLQILGYYYKGVALTPITAK
jgi:stage II sporulation protein D